MPAAPASAPLVSIGLPTYNRAGTLARAIDSALEQTYSDFELVISDNVSTDGTEALCRGYAEGDARVRYLRQQHNLGPTENFNTLFAECRGEFVMMLADDDWLDRGYVAACLAELRSRPDHALVAGRARYERDGVHVRDGVAVQLDQDDPAARVRGYYSQVDDNGTFYGLMRASALRAAAPMPNVLGNDWLLIAAVAFGGKIRTLPEPAIHRELGGTSADIDTILRTFGESSGQARAPHLVIARHVARHIRSAPVYDGLSRPARMTLAARSAVAVIHWRSLAYHLVAPLAERTRDRRGTRWIHSALQRARRRWGTLE